MQKLQEKFVLQGQNETLLALLLALILAKTENLHALLTDMTMQIHRQNQFLIDYSKKELKLSELVKLVIFFQNKDLIKFLA